jgi:hypothetical protein
LRKPSNTSPRNARDWRPTLFVDQTQSAELFSDILRAAKWRVVLHSVHFPGQSNLKDHLWIPAAIGAVEDCAIISSDRSMKLWSAEDGLVRPAIEKCNAKIFFLSGTSRAGRRTLQEQATAIMNAQTDICRHFRRYADTFFFGRIHLGNRSGEVEKLSVGTRRPRSKRAEVA